MSGPGCWLCLWAAASYFCCLWPHGCSGCRVVYLGRAALCARGRRPAREPSAPRASLGASPRSPARPRHRPRAPQPGLPVPPAPSTPVVPVVLRTIRLVSRPALALPPPTSTAAWPCRRPRAPQPGPPVPPAPHRRCLWFWCARPGSIAHGHRSQDFRSLRHPTGSDGGLAALGAVCRRVVGVSWF